MILSDREIKTRILNGTIGFENGGKYDIIQQIGPASIDFRLWHDFKWYNPHHSSLIDTNNSTLHTVLEHATIDTDQGFVLHPRQFVLWATLERIKIPYDLVARCEGRSSLGRLWIVIHSTAWFIDPGFEGTITLEITNINTIPVKIYPWMRFGQFAFETILWEVEHPYNLRAWSKYMNQQLPEWSRISHDKY